MWGVYIYSIIYTYFLLFALQLPFPKKTGKDGSIKIECSSSSKQYSRNRGMIPGAWWINAWCKRQATKEEKESFGLFFLGQDCFVLWTQVQLKETNYLSQYYSFVLILEMQDSDKVCLLVFSNYCLNYSHILYLSRVFIRFFPHAINKKTHTYQKPLIPCQLIWLWIICFKVHYDHTLNC